MTGLVGKVIRRGVSLTKRLAGYESVIFFRLPARGTGEMAPPELKEVDAATFEKWAASLPDFPWKAGFSSRFAEGHKFYALMKGAQPVCFGWATLSRSFPCDELHATCRLDGDVAWFWDFVTPTGHRGKGYYRAILEALQRRYSAYDRVIYAVAGNQASLKGIRNAGFEPWTRVRLWRGGHRAVPVVPMRLEFT
jgi:hypothetical protein